MSELRRFIYVDAKGQVSYREVHDPTETDVHLQAFDGSSLKTFRKDRILEEVTDDTPIPLRVKHWQDEHVRSDLRRAPVRPSLDGVLEVCFTGFKAADKERLTHAAELAGFMVRSKVTYGLHLLCYGANAGPSKMEQARRQQVIVLSEPQFLAFKETGEVPLED